MKTIYKYPLNANGSSTRIWIPGYRAPGPQREVLTIALQHDLPHLWVGVDTDEPKVAFWISLVGTGYDVDPLPSFAHYIGTVLLYGGRLVLHAFLHQDPDQSPDEGGEDEEP